MTTNDDGINLDRTFISERHLNSTWKDPINKQFQNFLNKSFMHSQLKQISGIPLVINNLEQIQSRSLNQTHKSMNQSQRLDYSMSKSKYFESSQLIQKQLKKQVKILAFKDRQGDHVNYTGEFKMFCCSQMEHVPCKWQIIDQSIFQLYSDFETQKNRRFVSINFDTINTRMMYIDDHKYTKIILQMGSYTLELACQQPSDTRKFHNLLTKIKKESKSEIVQLKILEQQQKFYEIRYETEQYFFNNCETGDILLFQDRHFFAKVQRLITNSDFDHVGMIIKDVKHGVLIFQTTSTSGVSLVPWKLLINLKLYEKIPRIVWRRLTGVNRDVEFRKEIEKFVNEKLETQFNISLRVITANQSIIRSQRLQQQSKSKVEKKKGQGFFCSQLIATLYKNLGLLTRDKSNPNYQPACKFYPKDFSQKSQRLLDNGSLSAEYQIYFDANLLKIDYPTFFKDQN